MNSLEEAMSTTLWDTLEIGSHVITFYASDLAGNTEMVEVVIEKITPEPEPSIPGFNILFLIGITSVLIILIRKYHQNV